MRQRCVVHAMDGANVRGAAVTCASHAARGPYVGNVRAELDVPCVSRQGAPRRRVDNAHKRPPRDAPRTRGQGLRKPMGARRASQAGGLQAHARDAGWGHSSEDSLTWAWGGEVEAELEGATALLRDGA